MYIKYIHRNKKRIFDKNDTRCAKTKTAIDASIVQVPRQRNTREENKQVREGVTPASVHDSVILEDLLDESEAGQPVYADSAYSGKNCDTAIKAARMENFALDKAFGDPGSAICDMR